MLRAAYISKIADKVGDSPQKMMTELGKLQKQANGQVFKTVFGGKHGKEIEGCYLFSKLPKEHLRPML